MSVTPDGYADILIADHHLAMLAASGISPEYAARRGYETITDQRRLAELKIVTAARSRTPGLLVPMLRVEGSTWGWQYRADDPRLHAKGRPIKYETPHRQRNGLDIPPGVGPKLADPSIPLWITEGVKKADCGALHGLCIVGLVGTWGWLGTNTAGGKMALADWRDVALNNGRRVIIGFDGDVARKPSVRIAMKALAGYLATKGARIEYLHLPDTDEKTGLDDYLAAHTVEDLLRLVKPTQPRPTAGKHQAAPPSAPKPEPAPAQPISRDETHKVFRKWLGEDYDTDALDICLAAVAVEKLDGDPLWVLIVSGPGNAKTETVQPFHSVGGIVVGSISSEAALLSATPERDRAKNATGGLLRKLGDRGLLVIKDVTSILAMDHITRGRVLSALREIYDGHWVRDVGAEGGRTIPRKGRVTVIGAVTSAWDTHHAVIAKMGDRFTLLRMNSRDKDTRNAAGLRSIFNTGDEVTMREELAAAVAGVITGMNTTAIRLTETESNIIVAAADLTTLARTSECDHRGDVIDAHDPEMPTRFAKQLTQVIRGAVAIGIDRTDAMALAIRCARDSMPPMRLAIIADVAEHPHSSTQEIRRRLDKPRLTVDRQLQALHALGVLTCDEVAYDEKRSRWYYTLAADVDPTALTPESCPEKLVGRCKGERKSESDDDSEVDDEHTPTHFSGQPGDPSLNGHQASAGVFVGPDGPGRCPHCHWHTEQQGHAPDCALTTQIKEPQ